MHPVCLLLPSAIRGVVLPTFALAVLIRFLHPSKSYRLSGHCVSMVVLLDLAWILFIALGRSSLVKIRNWRQRRSLGVDAIPAVRGWLPWNLDVFYTLVFPKEDYFVGKRDEAIRTEVGSTTYNLRLLGRDIIFTTDPSNVKTILSSDFASFDKGPTWRTALWSFLGSGIFNTDGEIWKFHRSLTRPFFARDKISDFSCFDRHIEDLFGLLEHHRTQGKATDVQDLFGRYTLDAAVDFLFGAQAGSLKVQTDLSEEKGALSSGQQAESFVKAFNCVQRISTERLKLGPLWPVSELGGDRMRPHMEVINDYLTPIVENALEKKKAVDRGEKTVSAELGGEDGHSLLDALLQESDSTEFVQNELLNILLAARDTTAALLTFTSYCLARNLAIKERLLDEIRTAIPEGAVPRIEDIREMKYLRAVLNETLRMYPPVPGNFRESTAPTVLPCRDSGVPKFMPANTTVCYMTFNTHRSKEHWGLDAERFDPDRWLDERMKRVTANPFMFHPFNGGPRICLGQQFAYNEASFVLIRLLQRYPDFSFAPDCQPEGKTRRPPLKSWKSWPDEVWPKTELILLSQGGLHIQFGQASHAPVLCSTSVTHSPRAQTLTSLSES